MSEEGERGKGGREKRRGRRDMFVGGEHCSLESTLHTKS